VRLARTTREVTHQDVDVVRPLSQGRNLYLCHTEPVVEVRPKRPLLDLLEVVTLEDFVEFVMAQDRRLLQGRIDTKGAAALPVGDERTFMGVLEVQFLQVVQ